LPPGPTFDVPLCPQQRLRGNAFQKKLAVRFWMRAFACANCEPIVKLSMQRPGRLRERVVIESRTAEVFEGEISTRVQQESGKVRV
jgi:hypothetical protein